jgi:hypothetical protein
VCLSNTWCVNAFRYITNAYRSLQAVTACNAAVCPGLWHGGHAGCVQSGGRSYRYILSSFANITKSACLHLVVVHTHALLPTSHRLCCNLVAGSLA